MNTRHRLLLGLGLLASLAACSSGSGMAEPRTSVPAPSAPSSPAATPRSEADQIIAEGDLAGYAADESGNLISIWEGGPCTDWDVPDCSYAWRLGTGSQPLATGIVEGAHGGYVGANAASGGDFVLIPSSGATRAYLIAPDGTTSALSRECRGATWSAPTLPGRLSWATGYNFVDTVAGAICPTSRFGGRRFVPGVFD